MMEIYCTVLCVALIFGLVCQGFARRVTYNNTLTCYSCFNPEPFCRDIQSNASAVEQKTCRRNEGFCMVERTENKAEQLTLTRSCAKTCTPGCEVLGGASAWMKCHSCCTTDLCNVDNHSSKPANSIHIILLTIWSVSLF